MLLDPRTYYRDAADSEGGRAKPILEVVVKGAGRRLKIRDAGQVERVDGCEGLGGQVTARSSEKAHRIDTIGDDALVGRDDDRGLRPGGGGRSQQPNRGKRRRLCGKPCRLLRPRDLFHELTLNWFICPVQIRNESLHRGIPTGTQANERILCL